MLASTNDAPPRGRVLICDDDIALLRCYQRALTTAGFEVTVAESGTAALSLINQRTFDAVLSDVGMPDMSGVDLLRRVREANARLPFLLITGGASVDTAVEAVELGALRYLLKPIEPEKVVGAVREAVTARPRAMIAPAEVTQRFDHALRTIAMVFQPIVSVTTGAVYAWEALVRNGEPTLASPNTLIETAEKLDRVHDLGRTIRARVAEVLAATSDAPRVFVNIHPHDLLDDELYSTDAPLARFADRVTIEVTERATLDAIPNVRSRMFALRAAGYSVAIDDLGAGYAGLATLAKLAPDVVKIDRSLTHDVHVELMNQRVIRALVDLCRQSDIVVIAEGVETAAERETMHRLGCHLQQGYLYARPSKGLGGAIAIRSAS